MTTNPNSEETKRLMNEIRAIREEIKSSTMGHFKSQILNAKMKPISNFQTSGLIKIKENLKINTHPYESIKHDLKASSSFNNINLINLECMQKDLERELDCNLQKITYYNKQSYHDSKSMTKNYQQDIQGLKTFYQDKLKGIKDDNYQSK